VKPVIGKKNVERNLSEREIRELCKKAFTTWQVAGKRLLFIIPDNTRSAPIDLMFRICYELIADKVMSLDFLIALGTHPQMSEEEILQRVNIKKHEWENQFSKARFFNHDWKTPRQLKKIGRISDAQIKEISNGLIKNGVDISINKMVLDYDLLIIIGPTYPHEVVGFSGGNKYLFPGISGQEIIDLVHWLGALITNIKISGEKNTPVRKVIDLAADMVPTKTLCLSLVTQGGGIAGLYIDKPKKAWSLAADLSSEIHIIYKDHSFKSVLSCVPEMYSDLWTGAKGMYKLEQVVADGGELIIFAPHISKISVTHGDLIEKTGYHVKEYFVQQADKFSGVPGGVLAHSTHLKGSGLYSNGLEKPRIQVTLATGISEKTCRRINLGYQDPTSINIHDWENRENEGIFIAHKAGEILYRLREKIIQSPS
jgi:nickel-dependent lactate racemase